MKNITKKLILVGIALAIFVVFGSNFTQASAVSAVQTINTSAIQTTETSASSATQTATSTSITPKTASLAPNTTVPGAPIIVTGYAKPIGITTATLRGAVNPNGGNTNAWFELSLGGSSGYSSIPEYLGNGNTPVSLTPYVLNNLTPNTTYQFRIVAINQYGTTARQVSFTTLPITLFPPTLTSINPSSGAQGQNNLSVALTGTGFIAGSTVNFSGTGITINNTTINSTTSISLDISINLTAPTGSRSVTVVNANGTSNPITFKVLGAVNPTPTLTSINPSSGAQGQNNLSVALTGTGFITGSTVNFSGTGITINNTTINSTTSITANISIDLNASTGSRSVAVVNTNGTSNPINFKVLGYTNVPPTLTSLSPASGTQGQTLNVNLTGTGFTGSTVLFSGSGIILNNTTINSDTSITTNISINTNATVGGSNVTVTNTKGTSNAQIFTVNGYYSGGGGGGGGGGGFISTTIIVTTQNATGILQNSATLNGAISQNNFSATIWFQYGTSYNLATYTETIHQSLGTSNYANLSQNIAGLNQNTTYYFRAVANNYAGTYLGNIISFTTTGINTNPVNPIVTINNPPPTTIRTIYQDNNPVQNTTETIPNNQTTTDNNYFGNKNLGATVVGFTSFLPNSFWGWLIFLIFILILIVIAREIYEDHARKKSLQKVNANHIKNLPF